MNDPAGLVCVVLLRLPPMSESAELPIGTSCVEPGLVERLDLLE